MKKSFTITETTGYFENPIILLNAKIVKKQAKAFMKKFLKLLSINQINQLIEEIDRKNCRFKISFKIR